MTLLVTFTILFARVEGMLLAKTYLELFDWQSVCLYQAFVFARQC